MSDKLTRLLETTLALSEQFYATLISASPTEADSNTDSKPTDALQLLSICSTALRCQVTKLSLFAITTPFTPSALSTVLTAVNDSVLPSLVTAALLVTPAVYTNALTTEVRTLSRTVLREYSALAEEVKKIAEKSAANTNKQKEEFSRLLKDIVTSATGRVWDACDTLTQLVSSGVINFVVRRVEEWRDLIKDAISELEEWDPDDDHHDFEDNFSLDDDENDAKDTKHEYSLDNTKDEDMKAALHRQRKATLRIFKPIGQIYPAIVSNRLKKGGLSTSGSSTLPPYPHITKLEALIKDLQEIPGDIDEAAGSLYENDITDSVQYVKKAKASAERVIKSVTLPWGVQPALEMEVNGQEDKFTAWSRTWLKVMDDVMNDVHGS